MSVEFKSTKGYYYLDVWVMANIIQQATIRFCQTHLDRTIDPCGRLYDQMTMAARSAVANIAEGASRRQTSKETEMKLTDVARASLEELHADLFSLAMMRDCEPWSKTSTYYQQFKAIQLDRPCYGDDIEYEAWFHVKAQEKKFAPWINHKELSVALNAMMLLINRAIDMLKKMMVSQFEQFKVEGGFTENLSQERVRSLTNKALSENAPKCPVCGKPMLKRTAKKGANAGSQFWSCSDYPSCTGTRKLK